MKIIRELILICLMLVICSVSVFAQYQRRRVPTKRTMNDSIKAGRVYEYKIYGDIEGTRRTTIRVYKIENDSVWYLVDGYKQVKLYKKLAKWLVLE